MKTDEKKTSKGKDSSNAKINEVERIRIGNMATFLQYVTPLRLEILNVLRQCSVPVPEKLLVGLLYQTPMKIQNDVVELERYGLIQRNPRKKLYVPWDSMQISVQQDYPYLQNAKIANIVDSYLLRSARKYPWIQVKLEKMSKTTASRVHVFKCVLELHRNDR